MDSWNSTSVEPNLNANSLQKNGFNNSCGDEQANILLVVTAIDYKKHKGGNYISAEFDRHNESHLIKGAECWYKRHFVISCPN
jgi:hypothetical protein